MINIFPKVWCQSVLINPLKKTTATPKFATILYGGEQALACESKT